MTLEDAVKACEAAPRKVKLKILRCVPAKAIQGYTHEIGLFWLLRVTLLFVSATEKTSR